MVFGKVKVNPIAIGVWGFFVMADGSVYALLVLLCALLHEMGHLVLIHKSGGVIQRLTVQPFGVNISLVDSGKISYAGEIKIALAGPLGSLAVAYLSAMVYFFILSHQVILFFAVCNLALFALNMLPIEYLDGGRMLKNALLLEFLPDTVATTMRVVTIAALIPLAVLGFCIYAQSGFNFSILLLAFYLIFLFLYKS